jgi:hypothetical protein
LRDIDDVTMRRGRQEPVASLLDDSTAFAVALIEIQRIDHID